MSDSDTSTSSDNDIMRGITRNDSRPDLVTEQDETDVRKRVSTSAPSNKKSNLVTDMSTDQHFDLFANMDKVNPQLQPVTRPSKTQISGLPPITEGSDENNSKDKKKDYDSDSSYETDTDDDSVLPGVQTYNQPKPSNEGPSYGSGSVAPKDSKLSGQSGGQYAGESKEDYMLRKLDMLRKLGELTQYGVKLSQRYTMESDYDMMKYEYEMHKSIRNKQNGIQYMAGGIVYAIKGVEMLNKEYNPFQFNLDGWSEHVNNDITNYYDVLGELYEKYFGGPGENFPPEIRLMGMILFSAASFHMTNSAINKLPSSDDAFKENPALMEQLKKQNMEQLKKQREALNGYSKKEHDEAIRKAKDLQFLQRAKEQYMNNGSAPPVPTGSAGQAGQAEQARQLRLQQLRQQLANQQMAQLRQQRASQVPQQPTPVPVAPPSGAPRMPTIPASMRSAGVTPPSMQQQQEQMQKLQQLQRIQQLQEQQKMQQLRNLQELQRQKQIAEHQQRLKEQDRDNGDDVRSRASKISNEEIDKILGVKEGSTIDSSSVSTDRSSRVSIRSRKRRGKRKSSKKSRFSVDTR